MATIRSFFAKQEQPASNEKPYDAIKTSQQGQGREQEATHLASKVDVRGDKQRDQDGTDSKAGSAAPAMRNPDAAAPLGDATNLSQQGEAGSSAPHSKTRALAAAPPIAANAQTQPPVAPPTTAPPPVSAGPGAAADAPAAGLTAPAPPAPKAAAKAAADVPHLTSGDKAALLATARQEVPSLEAELSRSPCLVSAMSGLLAVVQPTKKAGAAHDWQREVAVRLEGRTEPLSQLADSLAAAINTAAAGGAPPRPAAAGEGNSQAGTSGTGSDAPHTGGAPCVQVLTSAQVCNIIREVGVRKSYGRDTGVPNVDASEDATPARHWVWEVRSLASLPKALRPVAEAARRHRKQAQERLRAVDAFVALCAAGGAATKAGETRIARAAAKLAKCSPLADIRALLEGGPAQAPAAAPAALPPAAEAAADAPPVPASQPTQLPTPQTSQPAALTPGGAGGTSGADTGRQRAQRTEDKEDKEAQRAEAKARKEAERLAEAERRKTQGAVARAGFQSKRSLEVAQSKFKSFFTKPTPTSGGVRLKPNRSASASGNSGGGVAADHPLFSLAAPQSGVKRSRADMETMEKLDLELAALSQAGPSAASASPIAELRSAALAAWRARGVRPERVPGLPPSWARRPGADVASVAACARRLYGDGVDVASLRCWRRKLLRYHDSVRPAYYGSWSRTSAHVRRRRWGARDPEVDYEVESDQEWEEEPEGESLSDDDGASEGDPVAGDGGGEAGEQVEDSFMVADGYLSDDEGVNGGDEAEGTCDAGAEGRGPQCISAAAGAPSDARLAALEAALERARRAHRSLVLVDLPGVEWDHAPAVDPAALSALRGCALRPGALITPPLDPGALGSAAAGDGGADDAAGASAAHPTTPTGGGGRGRGAAPFPEALVSPLAVLVHGRKEGIDQLVSEFLAAHPGCALPKARVRDKIREITLRRLPGKGGCYHVLPELLPPAAGGAAPAAAAPAAPVVTATPAATAPPAKAAQAPGGAAAAATASAPHSTKRPRAPGSGAGAGIAAFFHPRSASTPLPDGGGADATPSAAAQHACGGAEAGTPAPPPPLSAAQASAKAAACRAAGTPSTPPESWPMEVDGAAGAGDEGGGGSGAGSALPMLTPASHHPAARPRKRSKCSPVPYAAAPAARGDADADGDGDAEAPAPPLSGDAGARAAGAPAAEAEACAPDGGGGAAAGQARPNRWHAQAGCQGLRLAGGDRSHAVGKPGSVPQSSPPPPAHAAPSVPSSAVADPGDADAPVSPPPPPAPPPPPPPADSGPIPAEHWRAVTVWLTRTPSPTPEALEGALAPFAEGRLHLSLATLPQSLLGSLAKCLGSAAASPELRTACARCLANAAQCLADAAVEGGQSAQADGCGEATAAAATAAGRRRLRASPLMASMEELVLEPHLLRNCLQALRSSKVLDGQLTRHVARLVAALTRVGIQLPGSPPPELPEPVAAAARDLRVELSSTRRWRQALRATIKSRCTRTAAYGLMAAHALASCPAAAPHLVPCDGAGSEAREAQWWAAAISRRPEHCEKAVLRWALHAAAAFARGGATGEAMLPTLPVLVSKGLPSNADSSALASCEALAGLATLGLEVCTDASARGAALSVAAALADFCARQATIPQPRPLPARLSELWWGPCHVAAEQRPPAPQPRWGGDGGDAEAEEAEDEWDVSLGAALQAVTEAGGDGQEAALAAEALAVAAAAGARERGG